MQKFSGDSNSQAVMADSHDCDSRQQPARKGDETASAIVGAVTLSKVATGGQLGL